MPKTSKEVRKISKINGLGKIWHLFMIIETIFSNNINNKAPRWGAISGGTKL